MAKKQSATPADAAGSAPDQPAEAKKPREGKGKEPREAKGKPDAAQKGPATAPKEVPAGGALAPPPAGTSAPIAAAAVEAAKRRGKRPGKPPRRGKKLRNQLKNTYQKVAKEGQVPLGRGIPLLKQIKRAKFDETVEVHMSLGIDPTQSDQMIRGSVSLPHGLGKVKRVVVFCQGDNVTRAKEAGADYAGGDDLIEKIQKEGWLDFDVALATQD